MLNNKLSILLLDDDQEFHSDFKDSFSGIFNIRHQMIFSMALKKIAELNFFDLILLDLELEENIGDYQAGLRRITQLHTKFPNLPVIIVSQDKNRTTALQAIRLGAEDFFLKDCSDIDDWSKRIDEAIDRHKNKQEQRNKPEQPKEKNKQPKKPSRFNFIGESNIIRSIKEELQSISMLNDISVLLLGETGTGKEVAARYIHTQGLRCKKSFISVNLSALPDNLIESNLFGHIKGSFTGATANTKGLIEAAEGGVLFLDEIGDIPLSIQIKLLRFLDYKTYTKVGDYKEIEADVHIIAATNRDLVSEVAKGNFREDLYYRLSQWEITIPSLRMRKEDIPLLIRHFCRLQSIEESVDTLFEKSILKILTNNDWFGNIRQLSNVINQMIGNKIRFKKQQIDNECIPRNFKREATLRQQTLRQQTIKPSTQNTKQNNKRKLSTKEKKALIEFEDIENLLIKKNGKKSDVAKELEKSLDSIRYFVESRVKKYPHLVEDFPNIRKCYKV